jgi:AbiU2
MNQPPENPKEDIAIFAEHCVFMRSVYRHGRILFEASTDEDKARMTRAAPVFFGDLNRMSVEYMILQVCKITDPARDFRKNDNHTIAFLLRHYDFSADPATIRQLAQLDARLQAFREKLLPARNKLISHSDRGAILAGQALGGAPQSEWMSFGSICKRSSALFTRRCSGRHFTSTAWVYCRTPTGC